ncbi:MAG: hypothetical protein JWO36_6859 [Myxococcales bacterium]|nr:hypothetical protein [Myxococcales bacterium]
MIPYEDLVIALQAWRAKQGLPIAQMSGQLAMPPPAAAPPAPAPRTTPPAAPRTNPPAAPPRSAKPLVEEHLDVEDAAMLEESAYENEGGDFAMSFADKAAADAEEATAIGGAPTAGTNPTGARSGGKRNDDW